MENADLFGRFFETIVPGKHYIGYLNESGEHFICIRGWDGDLYDKWVWARRRSTDNLTSYHRPIPEDDPRVDAWSAKLALLAMKGNTDA